MLLFLILTVIPFLSAYPGSSDTTVYTSQMNKCLKNIDLVPTNISNIFIIKIVKNHIELTVHNDEKFDYYEMNWKGYCCYKATGLNVIPIRTAEEQENCDNYTIGEQMDFYNFQCAYKIFDDKTYSIMIIDSNENSMEADVYAVNKRSGAVYHRKYDQLYSEFDVRVPRDGSDYTDQYSSEINECLHRKNNIPKSLPISFEITKRNSHIEILASYQNKFDFYKINWQGVYCHRERRAEHKPNETMVANNERCDDRPLSTHYDYGAFHCAYDIWTTVYDNKDYVVFSIDQTTDGVLGSNSYIIDTSANKAIFYDFVDKFSGGKDFVETIFERYKELDITISMKVCTNKRFELPEYLPVKLEIMPNNWTTEIFIFYENKVDYFDIHWNGTIRSFESNSDEIPNKQLHEPSQVSEEDTFTEFICPYKIVDDRDYTIIVIESRSPDPDAEANPNEAYVYIINKQTFEISFNFHRNYFHECSLEVPQSKIDKHIEFEREIESCVNRRNSIPEALKASIKRINDHIRITVDHDDGKSDYYEINYKGRTCYVARELTEPINRTINDAVRDCEKRRITSCTDVHSFSCGLEILNPEGDHYFALVLLSDLDVASSDSSSYAYLLDKLTNETDFRHYERYFEDEILVKQTESDKNPVYVSEFEECLNLKNTIPTNIPLKFNVTKVNNHINILVYDDGKYDYYEHNARGEACYTAVRMAVNPTRTFEEQMKCDARRLNSLKPYTEVYKPQFRCGFEVIRNTTDVVIFVHSTDGVYEYNVDRGTGKTELYLYEVFVETLREQQSKCSKRQYATDFDIPLEVTTKPKNLDKNENYLEILIKYQGKYDFYVTEESGYVRYTEMQLSNKPNQTLYSDYADKIQCQQNTNFRIFQIKNFQCPLKVVENANYVNISVNAFHYENVYVIDKATNAIKYFKVKDNLILSNLPIPDAELNYIADVDECMDKLLNFTGPFPVDVVRNKNFLQISVAFNETFDIYETTSSGREMCRTTRRALEKPSIESKLLENIYPDCMSCDEPAFTFTCPTVKLNEDENQATLEITHGPGSTTHLYKISKSSGEIFYDVTASLGPPQIGNVIKSLIG